jgi:L-amino acid N-acyltransferase YncA
MRPVHAFSPSPRRCLAPVIAARHHPPMTPMIRDSGEHDVPAITAIYGHAVRTGLASFEYDPPDDAEIARRRGAVLGAGYPHLVATDAAGAVLGYAYASAYRPRAAYRFSVENSIYVAPEAHGRGVGRALVRELITRCTAQGFRLMIAVIGDSANAASIALHAACGFTHAGLLRNVGWKHERWVDSVLMTLPLGNGAATPPQG